MFSFASETFTFTAEGSCGRYAVTWYGLPAATRPVVQPVRSKSEPPATSKMNRETCRITFILEKLDGILSTIGDADALVPNAHFNLPTSSDFSKSRENSDLDRAEGSSPVAFSASFLSCHSTVNHGKTEDPNHE